MKKKLLVSIIIGSMLLNVGCFNKASNDNNQGQTNVTSEDTTQAETDIQQTISETNYLVQFSEIEQGEIIAIMKTNMGDIKLRFFPELAPKAVENFLTHAAEGYYDGVTFHRIIQDFMIQGGDPLGNGTGGESIWGEPFEDEFDIKLRHFYGALSMANSGSNTNGSQFFIVQKSNLDYAYETQIQELIQMQDELMDDGTPISAIFPLEICEKYLEVGGTPYLDAVHTVFGQVYEGMDIVEKIAAVETDVNDAPIEQVIIETIEIMEY